MDFNLPDEVVTALDILYKGGFLGFVVGGCVRDTLMGVAPHDYDITTQALPEDILRLFSDYKCIETGRRFGTITVVINHRHLEITTMRRELGYSDSRRPDQVEFSVDILEDLARRDFKMNAIAYSPKSGIVDPFLGALDIENKTISAVGLPEARFKEDGLRILRALRFSATLGFSIEPCTVAGMEKSLATLECISAERIRDEWVKILCGSNAPLVLTEFFNIFASIMPEIKLMWGFKQHSKYHHLDVWHHTLAVLDATPKEDTLRLAAFFHDIGKPHTFTKDNKSVGHFYGHEGVSADIARVVMRRLRFSNSQTDRVCKIILMHRDEQEKNQIWARRILNKMGNAQGVRQVLSLMRADACGKAASYRHSSDMDMAEKQLNIVLERGDCYNLKMLAVKGEDLLESGVSPSKVGIILGNMLERVIIDPRENKKAVLLQDRRVGK